MKAELTDYGWKTTTIKHFRIRSMPHPLMTVAKWVEVNERMFPDNPWRHHCRLCKLKWRDLPFDGNVNLVFMYKEKNQTICDPCAKALKERVKLEDIEPKKQTGE